MLTFIPAGLLGVVVAGLLAAYVSTISTHLNWGTSYLVNDLYRRFMRPGADEAHYVMAGRLVTALLMALAALFTLILDTARTSFDLLLSVGAGTGLLYLLRWFWWRINAWSEIAAMASSFLLAAALLVARQRGVAIDPTMSLVVTVAVTSAAWLAATWLTAPTDAATLRRFYEIARPAGPGWSHVRRAAGGLAPSDDLRLAFGGWAIGCAFVYAALFGMGHFLMGHTISAAVAAVIAVASGAALVRLLPRVWAS
jgi:Na+(H+)/acetate symporter ActP